MTDAAWMNAMTCPDCGDAPIDNTVGCARCLRDDLTVRDELLELAWGLIANANEGDWDTTDVKWHAAAIDWRENWHRLLGDDR